MSLLDVKHQLPVIEVISVIITPFILVAKDWTKIRTVPILSACLDAGKAVFGGFMEFKGADQLAHPRSLISTFVIRLLESIISRLATSKISIF